MRQFSKIVGGMALSLLLAGILTGPAILEAQVAVPDASDGRWPLQPTSPGNNTLALCCGDPPFPWPAGRQTQGNPAGKTCSQANIGTTLLLPERSVGATPVVEGQA